MMKKLVIPLILLIMMFCSKNPSPEKEILAVMEMQEKAWSAGDIDTFMQGYWQSDSLMFVGKNGIKYGWKTTR